MQSSTGGTDVDQLDTAFSCDPQIRDSWSVFKPQDDPRSISSWKFSPQVVQGYLSKNVSTLYEWQAECLSTPGVILDYDEPYSGYLDFHSKELLVDKSRKVNRPCFQRPRWLLYCAPTSGGKTLVAELIALRRLFQGPEERFPSPRTGNKFKYQHSQTEDQSTFILFALPFIALVDEKASSLSKILNSNALVEGEKQMNPINVVALHSQSLQTRIQPNDRVVLATFERANAIISSMAKEKTLHRLKAVVVDELHMIGESDRGIVIELLLSKLLHAVKQSDDEYREFYKQVEKAEEIDRKSGYQYNAWIPSTKASNSETTEGSFSKTESSSSLLQERSRTSVPPPPSAVSQLIPPPPRVDVQVIGMSATLPNMSELATWLDAELFVTNYRPVPLKEYIKLGPGLYEASSPAAIEAAREQVRINGLNQADYTAAMNACTSATVPSSSESSSTKLSSSTPIANMSRFPPPTFALPKPTPGRDNDGIVTLSCQTLLQRAQVLIFASTKAGTQATAKHVSQNIGPMLLETLAAIHKCDDKSVTSSSTYSVGNYRERGLISKTDNLTTNGGFFSGIHMTERIAIINRLRVVYKRKKLIKNIQDLEEEYSREYESAGKVEQNQLDLLKCISLGTAWHHSNLVFAERKEIESGYNKGAISILVATSTLAAGVNLPARRVIFRSPFIAQNILDIVKYRQMAGRAGRAGKDTFGEAIMIPMPDAASDVKKYKQLPLQILDIILSKMDHAKSQLGPPIPQKAILASQTPPDEDTDVQMEPLQLQMPSLNFSLGEGSGFSKLLLESIGANLIQSRKHLPKLLESTLYSIQFSFPLAIHLVTQMLEYMLVHQLVEETEFTLQKGITVGEILVKQTEEYKKRTELKLKLTHLGQAAIAASLDAHTTLKLYSSLQLARKSFVTAVDFHYLFLLMSSFRDSFGNGIIEGCRPSWDVLYRLLCGSNGIIDPAIANVARKVGLQPDLIQRAAKKQVSGDDVKPGLLYLHIPYEVLNHPSLSCFGPTDFFSLVKQMKLLMVNSKIGNDVTSNDTSVDSVTPGVPNKKRRVTSPLSGKQVVVIGEGTDITLKSSECRLTPLELSVHSRFYGATILDRMIRGFPIEQLTSESGLDAVRLLKLKRDAISAAHNISIFTKELNWMHLSAGFADIRDRLDLKVPEKYAFLFEYPSFSLARVSALEKLDINNVSQLSKVKPSLLSAEFLYQRPFFSAEGSSANIREIIASKELEIAQLWVSKAKDELALARRKNLPNFVAAPSVAGAGAIYPVDSGSTLPALKKPVVKTEPSTISSNIPGSSIRGDTTPLAPPSASSTS
jgi:DEAD/DEAH box helicase/Helicase conserved C-terminal domain